MKIVTAAQMREIDRRASEEFEIKGEVLMERAGSGVASVVRRMAEMSGFANPVVHLIAGRGQNGGDVFVAARLLKEGGYQVDVSVAAHFNQICGDALIHFGRMKAAGIEPYEIPTLEDWQQLAGNPFYSDIVVDGVLGTGLKGPARGPAAGAIGYIRDRSAESLVVSIDLPSGIDGDTGIAEGQAVEADVTATIGLPKSGLVNQAAIDSVGCLEVIDIGIPDELVDEVNTREDLEFLYLTDLKPLFRRRRRTSHKGDYGHVLVVAGSRRYAGAAALCGRAALRAGAGLVTVLAPERLQAGIVGDTPELIVWPGCENASGALSVENMQSIEESLSSFSAMVIGPGLTACDDTLALVRFLIERATVPVLLDADALHCCVSQPELLKSAKAGVVLTPHPGELAGMLGITSEAVQSDRIAALSRAVKLTASTVVLKGAGTLVAAPGKTTQINLNGNPGMATAGSGDVLAGLIGGLLAQGFSPFDAARTGVYVHGRAGDYAAWRRCQSALLAGDLLEEIPYALRDLSPR